MIKYYIFILLYTVLSSFAAFFLKKASGSNKNFLQLIFFEKNFYLGGILYFLASIGSIIALKYLPYNIVYFCSAITYVWSVIIGRILLKENFSKLKVYSLLFICLGIFLMIL